jgi:hypothetical protein
MPVTEVEERDPAVTPDARTLFDELFASYVVKSSNTNCVEEFPFTLIVAFNVPEVPVSELGASAVTVGAAA